MKSQPTGGHCRTALAAALLVCALVAGGCAKRFGGPWPFGTDQTADLAKYGPVSVQRIEQMQARAKKMGKATAEEREAFAAELARQMPDETDCTVRMAIIDILSKIDAPSAGAVLFAGLKDPEADVRITCCEAWSRRPGPDATRILAETLSSDTEKHVRLAAAKALAKAEDADAVKALAVALEDPDPALQYVAVASLRNVTGQDLGNDVQAWRELARRDDPPLRSKSVAQRMRDVF